MLALALVAASLGVDNFAAAIGIGLAGVDRRLRLRVAIAFGLFEGGMPVVGVAVGRQVAAGIGSHADLIAGGLLIATGLFTAVSSRFGDGGDEDGETGALRNTTMVRLLISGAALSIDNLIVGFALGTYRVSIWVAAVIITIVSVGVSLAGLELGGRLGRRVEYDAELLGGAALVGIGVAIAAGVL